MKLLIIAKIDNKYKYDCILNTNDIDLYLYIKTKQIKYLIDN